MKTKLIAVSFLALALLAGCATADKLNDVRIGMSKDQVISLLGKPDSTSAQANIEYLTYYLSNDANYGRDRPYSVRVVDGKVESFGRFTQLFDIYNRPVNGETPAMMGGLPSNMPVINTVRSERVFGASNDVASQLQRLKTLKDQGVLTEEEFQKLKQRIIDNPK
jgi:hypothetical protein